MDMKEIEAALTKVNEELDCVRGLAEDLPSYIEDVEVALQALRGALADEEGETGEEEETVVARFHRTISAEDQRRFGMVVDGPDEECPLVVGLRLPDERGVREPLGWWLGDADDVEMLAGRIAESSEFIGWPLHYEFSGVLAKYPYAAAVLAMVEKGWHPDPHRPDAWIGRGEEWDRSALSYTYLYPGAPNAREAMTYPTDFTPTEEFTYNNDIGAPTPERLALWHTLGRRGTR